MLVQLNGGISADTAPKAKTTYEKIRDSAVGSHVPGLSELHASAAKAERKQSLPRAVTVGNNNTTANFIYDLAINCNKLFFTNAPGVSQVQ